MIASTPIAVDDEKNCSKRKSDSETQMLNTSKRQKSVTEGSGDWDSTILKLRPRRRIDNTDDNSSFTSIEEDDSMEEDEERMLSIECYPDDKKRRGSVEIINVVMDDYDPDKTESVYSDIASEDEGVLDDKDRVPDGSKKGDSEEIIEGDYDPDQDESVYSDIVSEDEGVLDGEEDHAQVNKEDVASDVRSSGSRGQSGARHDQDDSAAPGSSKSLSEEKLLAIKRKQMLRKIRKLPISERFILHGRNLLPWNQKVIFLDQLPAGVLILSLSGGELQRGHD